jgi:hypothetical protein
VRSRLGFRVFSAIVIMWLLEGAVRKWVAPSLSQPLFFARDPLMLALAILAFRDRSHRLSHWRTLLVLWSFFIVTVAFATAVPSNISLLVLVYGIIMYIGWLLLGVAGGSVIDREDAIRVLHWLRHTAPPMSVLGLIQVLSPASSAVNAVGDPTASILTTTNGVARSSLTFTSPAGAAGYISLILAIVLSLRAKDWYSRYVIPFSAILLAVTSGSRGVIFLGCALVAGLALLQVLASPGRGAKMMLQLAVVAVAGICAATSVAPLVIQSFEERFVVASQSEDTNTRLLGGLLGGLDALPHATLLGTGIGSLSRGAAIVGSIGWAEGDLARNVLEMGSAFGAICVIVRWSIALHLAWRGLTWLFSRGDLAPMAITLTLLPTIGWGQVTGQGSVQAVAGISIALFLAMSSRELADCRMVGVSGGATGGERRTLDSK